MSKRIHQSASSLPHFAAVRLTAPCTAKSKAFATMPAITGHPSTWRLNRLPGEMLDLITGHLDPEAYLALAIVHYPMFARRRLVPPLTPRRLASILDGSPFNSQFALTVLPPEILLEVMARMPRRDMMSFVIANYRHLADVGIAPPLTDAVVQSFLLACPP